MPKFNLWVGLNALLALTQFISLSVVSRSAHAAEVTSKTFRYTLNRPGEKYYVSKRDRRLFITMRERDVAVESNTAQWFEERVLQAVNSYDGGLCLGFVFFSDKKGEIAETIAGLGDLDRDDVHVLTLGNLTLKDCQLLSTFTQLRELTLTDTTVLGSKQGAAILRKWTKLEQISSFGSGEIEELYGSRDFVEALVSLKSLRGVSIPAQRLVDADIELFANHPSLEAVFLDSRKPVFTGKSLRALQQMPKLRELSIVCTDDITCADVVGFADIKSFERLSITSDADLDCLPAMRRKRPDCVFELVPPSDK